MQAANLYALGSVIGNVRDRKRQEIWLDYNTISKCRQIVTKHHQVKKCLEAIYNRLFKYGIEVMVGDRQASVKRATREHLNKYYIPFCKDFIMCYYEMGIVPVSLYKLSNGQMVPRVVKDLGFISVILDYSKNNGREYAFYKTYSKRDGGRGLPTPKLDKHCHIFSGYGHDPDINGSICSPMAACLRWASFNEKMFTCAYMAEERNTQPQIVTEIADPALAGDKSMGTSVDIRMWFGDRDRAGSDATMDKIMLNNQQMMISEQMNKKYIDSWNNMMSGTDARMRGRNDPAIPLPMPMYPLPAGHRIAPNLPHATARGDLLSIDEREEEIISSIFGVPKTLFTGEMRTTGGVQASSEMLAETLMAWRSRLTEVLTLIFKCSNFEEVCDMFEEEVKTEIRRKNLLESSNQDDKNLAKELKEIMTSVASNNEISIQFPVIPYENTDEMWSQYLRGVISYQELVIYSKMASGLPVNETDRNTKPPWENPLTMALLMGTLQGEQATLFQGRFAPSQPGEGGGGSSGEKKKKKKSSSEKMADKKKKDGKEKTEKREKNEKDKDSDKEDSSEKNDKKRKKESKEKGDKKKEKKKSKKET